LVSGAGIPWALRIGARVSSTHPTGQRACRRPANFIVGGQLGVVPVVEGEPVRDGRPGPRAEHSGGNPPAPEGESEAGTLPPRLEHAERRALRLFLCSPPCRDSIAQLQLRHPLHREALGFLWHLHQRLAEAGGGMRDGGQPAGDGLLAEALRLAPRLEPPLAALISSLAAGGSVVCSALVADPGAELGVVLDALE
ncbi:MAG: hypothetical protein ACK546_00030, partial [bacterium]